MALCGQLLSAQPLRNAASAACRGLNNDVYLTWHSNEGLCFLRSADGGLTWVGAPQVIARSKSAALYAVDGRTLQGTPVVVCDTGQSRFRGRIYVCWSDERYGTKNKDVFLAYSDDKGNTWSDPNLITYRPNHREQFAPAMAIDGVSGQIAVVYYDRQSIVVPERADVYLAVSDNGGLKYDYYRLNEQVVNTAKANPLQLKVKYAQDGAIVAEWTALNRNGQPVPVMVKLTAPMLAQYSSSQTAFEIVSEKSFVFAPRIKLVVSCPSDCQVSGILTKPLEPAFEKVAFKNMKCKKGDNTIWIDTNVLKLKKDNYILTFYYNGRNNFVWLLPGS